MIEFGLNLVSGAAYCVGVRFVRKSDGQFVDFLGDAFDLEIFRDDPRGPVLLTLTSANGGIGPDPANSNRLLIAFTKAQTALLPPGPIYRGYVFRDPGGARQAFGRAEIRVEKVAGL